MEILATEKVIFRLSDKDKSIFMRDKTDLYNEQSAFSRNKRGYNKLKEAIHTCVSLGDKSTFSQWVDIADKHGMRMHVYCAID